MPGSIPLATGDINSELAQYLPDQWKAIIAADVDGPSSEPARIDSVRPLFGQRALTRRLARTVSFGAAPTIGSAHKGIETKRVFLGTATPGDVVGNFHPRGCGPRTTTGRRRRRGTRWSSCSRSGRWRSGRRRRPSGRRSWRT